MLESLSPPTFPSLDLLLACAVAAVLAAVGLAAAFGPMLSVISIKLSALLKRAFYAKAAQQTAQMSLLCGLVASMLLAACFLWLASGEPALLLFPYRLPTIVTGCAIAATLLLFGAYVLWHPAKGLFIVPHTLLGLVAAHCSFASLFLCVGMIRQLFHTVPEIDPSLAWDAQLRLFFIIPGDSFFWPLLLEAVPLGFAFAGAFAGVWLILLRQRQDYGRDYYAFALPYCAKWALFTTLLAIPAAVYAMLRGREIMLPELSHSPSLLLDVLSIALPLLGCALWTLVIRSEHPMRRKVSVFAAAFFLLMGFAGQILMLNKIIPSP